MNRGRGGPMPMMGGRGRGPMPPPPPGRGFGGPGRGNFGPMGGRGGGPMQGRGPMGHYGPAGMMGGPGRGGPGRGPMGPPGRGPMDPREMGRYGPHGGRGPMPPPPPPGHPGGRGPMPPHMMGRGTGPNHTMGGRGPPPPPPPPRPMHNNMQGGPPMGPPGHPSYNNGPPGPGPPPHMQMNNMHHPMPGPRPPPGNMGGPPGMPPFQSNGGLMRPPNQPPMGPPGQPPYGQPPGYPQQPPMQPPPPGMGPNQYQQQQPPYQPPGMPGQYPQPPPNMQHQPPPQSMPQRPPPQQPLPATPPKPASADAAWTEHKSPAGVPYFYNTVTGVSTYDRPVALGGTATAAASAPAKEASGTAAAAAAAAAQETKPKWQTYMDEKTGKKYYSDGTTTTWTRPAELGPEEEIGGAAAKKKRITFEDDGRKPKRKKTEKAEESPYASKAEAVAAFKGLLLAKDVAPTTKWNDVVRACSDDARWNACAKDGERKQALAEYQTKRANELRDVKRQEKVRAKEAFQRLLTDVLPANANFAPGASRFVEVRDSLSRDDRFHAVEDETTREELFYEWVEELRKKEERGKRNKKREAKEGFLAFLKAKEEEGRLTFASTWTSLLSSLSEAERSDARFATGTHMTDQDRQLYFSDRVIELQNAEDERRRRIRDARRRAEKAQRDAFREKLSEMAKEGLITPETRWRGVEERVSSRYPDAYGPVREQGREVARELFEDFVYDWREEYGRDRATLVRVWESSSKRKEFKFDDKASADGFGKALLESSAGSPELYGEIRRISNRENPVSSFTLYFNQLRAETNGHGKKQGVASKGDESSEDEGEIVEDGEVDEK